MSSLPACMYMISGGTVILLEIFWTVICHLGLFAQLCSTKHSSLGPASVNMWWKQNRNMPRLFPILQSITVNLYARAVLGCLWLSWKHKAPQGRGDGADGSICLSTSLWGWIKFVERDKCRLWIPACEWALRAALGLVPCTTCTVLM